jgi:hypothetical protein
MDRSHAAAQEEGVAGGGGGFRHHDDEEELVIRLCENCQQSREQEQHPSFCESFTLVVVRHHVVLALPRALLDGGAHVSCGVRLRSTSETGMSKLFVYRLEWSEVTWSGVEGRVCR